jgi:hypothetical protein
MAMDPVAALKLVGNPEVEDVASMVRQRIEAALNALG